MEGIHTTYTNQNIIDFAIYENDILIIMRHAVVIQRLWIGFHNQDILQKNINDIIKNMKTKLSGLIILYLLIKNNYAFPYRNK